jgi:type II secretory pathway pseudopilin PulG
MKKQQKSFSNKTKHLEKYHCWHGTCSIPLCQPRRKNMMSKIKNQMGMALLESILGTVLFSIGLTGGLFLMQNATRASVNTDFNVIASQFANEKLETIIADKALKGNRYDDIVANNYPNESLTYEGVSNAFVRTVVIEEVDPSNLTTPQAGSGMKKVDVTVQWNNGNNQQILVSTLVADY